MKTPATRLIVRILLTGFSMMHGYSLFSQNTSVADGDWNIAATWSAGHVPTAAENVVIAHNVSISATSQCAELIIQTGKTLTLSGSNTLTVSGDWTTNGTFVANTGKVILDIKTNVTKYIYGKDPMFYDLSVVNTNTAGNAYWDCWFINLITVTNNFNIEKGKFASPREFRVNNFTIFNLANTIFYTNGSLIKISGNWADNNAAVPNSVVESVGQTQPNGVLKFVGTGAQSWGGKASQKFYEVEFENTGTVTLQNNATFSIIENLTLKNGSAFTAGTGSTIYIGYQWIDNGGTFNPSDGTVAFNSQVYYCYITGSKKDQTFNNITVAMGTHAVIAEELNTLTLNGSILFKGSPASANQGAFWPPATMTVKKDVTFEAGYKADWGGFFTPMTLYVGGNWTNNALGGERQAFNTYDAGMWTLDKVVFNGTSPQTISGSPSREEGGKGQTFQGITIDNPTTVTVLNTVDSLFINDNLTILQGSFIYNGTTVRKLVLNQRSSPECLVLTGGALNTNNNTVIVAGDVKQTGGTVNSTGLFKFFADPWYVPQHVPTGTYTNLYFDDNSKTLNPGLIKIAGVFRAGTVSPYNGVTTDNIVTGNTIEFSSATAQNIPSFNLDDGGWTHGVGYGGLKFSGGAKTLTGNIGVSETFDFPGNLTLGARNVVLGKNATIAGTLSNTHMIIINGAGKLFREFSAAQNSFTYPVGYGTYYIPVTLSFDNITKSGHVGVSFKYSSAIPNIQTPPAATYWFRQYWNFDNSWYSRNWNDSPIAFNHYSARVNYRGATNEPYNTNIGNAQQATMIARLYDFNASTWNAFNVSSRINNSPTVSGITTMGNLTFYQPPCASNPSLRPDLAIVNPPTTCKVNLDGPGIVTDNNGVSGVLSFHTTQTDAENATNKLTVSQYQNIVVSGTYWVRKTIDAGCYDVKPITVSISPPPVPSFTAAPDPVCQHNDYVYTTQSGQQNYIWSVSGGSVISGAGTNSITVRWANVGSGSVSINYTNMGGCAAVAPVSVPVTVNPAPTPSFTAGDAIVCQYDAGKVYSTQASMSNYVWNVNGGTITSGGGPSNSSVTVKWNSSGAQSVSVNYSNVYTCTAASAEILNVTVNPTPDILVTTPPAVCSPSAVDITEAGLPNYVSDGNSVSGTYTYHASLADANAGSPVLGGFDPEHVNSTTTVWMRKESAEGCKDVASIGVTVNICSITWTGSVSSDWSNPGNWNLNIVPSSAHNVFIPSTADLLFNDPNSHDPRIVNGGPNAFCHDMFLYTGSNLSIDAGMELNVSGNWTSESVATVQGEGAVRFNSSVPFGTLNINGSTTFPILINNNNNFLFVSSGMQTITRVLALQRATLAASGRITLASDATHSAMIDNFSLGYTGTITGNITVNRSITGNKGYRYLSSPASGTTIASFGPSLSGADGVIYNPGAQYLPWLFPTCWIYNEDDANAVESQNFRWGWVSATNQTSSLITMKGYAVIVNGAQTLSFTGTAFSGSTSIPISYTPSGYVAADGYNLIGNPYPSPISWNAILALPGNSGQITNVVSRFASNSDYMGQYAQWNGIVGTNGANDHIALGQGFFVKALPGASLMVMENSVRVRQTAAGFFEEPAPTAPNSLVRLRVMNEKGGDETVVYVDQRATDAYDEQIDGIKLLGTVEGIPNLYSRSGEAELSINAISALNSDKEIPLDIVVAGSIAHRIEVMELTNLDPTIQVYLEDREQGKFYDLRITDKVGLDLAPGLSRGRFFLHLGQAVAISSKAETCSQNDGQIVVSNPSAHSWDVDVINAGGVIVAQAEALKSASHTFSGLADGQYRIRLNAASGYATEQQLSIAAGADLRTGFEMPQTTVLTGQAVQFRALTTGQDMSYSWSFGDGTGMNGTAEPVHSYAEPGMYKVSLSQSNGICGEVTEQMISVRLDESTTSIEEQAANSYFSLYPNPANERVSISLKSSGRELPELVEVHDAAGRIVMRIEKPSLAEGAQLILPVKELANGSYLVSLTTNKYRVLTKYLIVNK